MRILGVDTTRKKANVFVMDSNNESIYNISLSENIKHSDGLFLYIEKVLLDNNIDINDIDVFSCVTGPGSFTGIRVGMATIKGINKALNKSLIAMNMFEVLLPSINNGYIVLNSTSTACYYAKVVKGEISETGVINKAEIITFVKKGKVVVLKEEQDVINLAYDNIKIIENLDELYKECVLKKLNTMKYGEMVPYYLQLSQAERNIANE